MIEALRRYGEKFDALSLRERLMVLGVVVVAIALPVLLYLIEPAQQEQVRVQTTLAKLEAENASAVLEEATLQAKLRDDPNRTLQQEVEALQQQIDALNARLQERAAQLISPQDMLGVLEQVLQAQQKLRLISLEKGDPQPFRNPATEDDGEQSGIYRHDLVLVVEGSFFDTVAYLKALEQLPQGFFWDELDYQVDAYPRARVTLRVHTLSTAEGWLGV